MNTTKLVLAQNKVQSFSRDYSYQFFGGLLSMEGILLKKLRCFYEYISQFFFTNSITNSEKKLTLIYSLETISVFFFTNSITNSEKTD